MNTRNRDGKIARLPRFVREELNERLERSEESPQLLDWVNALPEVQEVVQNDFAGVPSQSRRSASQSVAVIKSLKRRNQPFLLCQVDGRAGKLGTDEATRCH